MTKDELNLTQPRAMLGRLKLFKPAKNAKIGIPIQSWHHLAVIDDLVLRYVWDTRVIDAIYKLSDLTTLDCIAIPDSGKQLLVSEDKAVRDRIAMLLEKYPDLPIDMSGTKLMNLTDCRLAATAATLSMAGETGIEATDDFRIVFVPKHWQPLPDMFMYEQAPTVNPDALKFIDRQTYNGMSKQFAIMGRIAVIRDLIKSNN